MAGGQSGLESFLLCSCQCGISSDKEGAAGLILGYFKKHCKVTAGVIVGLHTFGARMQFNPHVHMLVTMGGMTRNGEWKVYDYIPFERLRKQRQTVVLKLIRKHLSASEKREVQPFAAESIQK